MAIFFLLWNVLVTSTLADNILKPLLIGGKDTEMSTLVVFLGVFGGITAFGLLGRLRRPDGARRRRDGRARPAHSRA